MVRTAALDPPVTSSPGPSIVRCMKVDDSGERPGLFSVSYAVSDWALRSTSRSHIGPRLVTSIGGPKRL